MGCAQSRPLSQLPAQQRQNRLRCARAHTQHPHGASTEWHLQPTRFEPCRFLGLVQKRSAPGVSSWERVVAVDCGGIWGTCTKRSAQRVVGERFVPFHAPQTRTPPETIPRTRDPCSAPPSFEPRRSYHGRLTPLGRRQGWRIPPQASKWPAPTRARSS